MESVHFFFSFRRRFAPAAHFSFSSQFSSHFMTRSLNARFHTSSAFFAFLTAAVRFFLFFQRFLFWCQEGTPFSSHRHSSSNSLNTFIDQNPGYQVVVLFEFVPSYMTR